jgi:hypothetical protein
MENTVFGFTEAQIADFGLTFCIGVLVLLMVFIVSHLAWSNKAGKMGTFALFMALTFGMVGFVAKYFIQHYMLNIS